MHRSLDCAHCQAPQGMRVVLILHVSHLTADVAQVLLAVAAGAWLLTPEWVDASLQAGHWLPEAPFQAQVRTLLCVAVLFCMLPHADVLAMHALQCM